MAVSASMLLAVLIGRCGSCGGWPVVGFLYELTSRGETGIIIVGTLLLFPVALTLYGGYLMFFAAKDTVEWWSERRRRRIFERGRDRGQKDERERIKQELERRGAPLTPELAEILDGKPDDD